MSFSIHIKKKSSASNKPPDPVPDPELYPHKLKLSDGRDIWISVPQPDSLCLTIPITPEVYANPEANWPVKEFVQGLGEYLKSEPFNAHHVKSDNYESTGWKRTTLQIGGRQSYVLFERLSSKKYGSRLRIDLNPRKLGPKGFKQLALVLGGENAPFALDKLIAVARVTRLDICVDVVGLPVSEIVGWHTDQGKRTLYLSPSGALETLYIHRKLVEPKQKYDAQGNKVKLKHKAKPAGDVLLRIYDRVAERTAVLAKPPFGPAPVTRIELVVKRLVKWKSLPLIPQMDDRFEKVRVGWCASQIQNPRGLWQNYLAMRRGVSAAEVRNMLILKGGYAEAFTKAETVPNPDIICPKETWKGWKDGLTQTGLMGFLNGEC